MDDLKYVFTVDDKDIIATIKNHEILEKRVGSLTKQYAVLDKALNEGRIDLLDYAKAVQQLDKQIAQVEGTLKKGGSAVNQLATGMNISGKASRNMELRFQQAGYQIQDFIVQVQGGVNPLIAFSQQGSQLAGFFAGPWGAAIGLGIAAFSSLAMALLSTTEAASETTDVFNKLAEATHQLWVERMKLADSKFDENLIGTQDELKKLTAAYNSAKAAVESLALEQSYIGTDITTNISDGRAAQDAAEAALKEAEGKLKSYNIQKNLLLIAETQKTLDEQSAKQRLSDQDAYFEKLKAEAEARKKISDDVGKAYLDALKLGQLGVSDGIDKAAEAARILAERLNISLEAARDMVNLAAGGGGRRDPREVGFSYSELSKDPRIQLANQAAWKPPKTKTSGAVDVAGKVDTQEEYIAKLTREYEMKKKSLGLTDEQVKRTEFLFSLDERLSTMKTKRSEVEIETEKQRAIAAYDAYAAAEKQAATMDMISSNLNTAFMSMIDGSQTVAGAFRNMMTNILKSVIEQTVTQPAANAVSGLLSGLMGGIGGGGGLFGGSSWSANGNIVGSSGIQAFAKGGVVGSPTMFKHGGGLGVMGEAGPEAIMPLKRGSNGKLGVQVDGGNSGNGGNITVNNNINVVGSDAAMVRAEVTKMIPQITEASKMAVIDAKRRGGQMGAAFR